MSKKIFIGGLPLEMTQQDLHQVLEEYAPIISIKLISDRDTGKSRGFGFVELEDANADRAISELDGASIENNRLKVSLALPPSAKTNSFGDRPARPAGGFSGNRNGGGNRSGGFGGGNARRGGSSSNHRGGFR